MNRFNDDESSGEEEEVILLEDDFGSNITQEELIGYAQFLGFDIENDLEYLSIAHDALKKPLPEGWKRAYLKNSNRMCYIDLTNQQFYLYSPVDEEAINTYQQAKKQKEKKSTVVPKTKLMPIGESIQEKKKAKKLNKDNLISNFDLDKNKENAQIKRYDVDKENNMKDSLKNKEKGSQETSAKKNTNNIARKFIEDLEGFDQLNIPSPEIRKKSNVDEQEKIKEKEQYYNEAKKKLINFEEELKREHLKKKENHELNEKKMKKKFEEENRKMTDKQVEELEDKIKIRVEDIEQELKDNNVNIIQELNKLNDSNLKKNLEELEIKIKTLKDEEVNLTEELRKPVEEEPIEQEENKELSLHFFKQAKYLLEEKFQVEMNTLEKKYKNKEREVEKEIESDRNVNSDIKEKNNTNKDFTNNNVLGGKLEEMLNEYKNALEKEFEIYSNSLKNENDEKILKEINKIKDQLDSEEAERNNEFMKETELIHSYFSKELYINQETSRAFEEKSAKIKENFDTSVENIEELKLKIKDNLDSILEELLSKLPDKNHFKDSFTLSKGFEDNLVVFNDEKILSLHKKKNKLELIELEYKEKSILFEYFIDIGSELIKVHRENSEIFHSKLNEETCLKKYLNQKLFSLYREKVQYYTQQLRKLKSVQIYNLKSFNKPDFSASSSQNIYSVRSSFEEKIKEIPYKLSKDSFRYGENLTQFSLNTLGNQRFPKFYSKSPDIKQSKYHRETFYKDLELEIDNILLQENGSNKMNLPFNPNFKRKLSFEEVLKKINNENLFHFRKVEKFIENNMRKIETELKEIDNEKKMQNNLKNALINSFRDNSTSRGSREKPYHFYESVRVLDDDQDRITVKKESIALKQANLTHIKNRFEEFKVDFPSKLNEEKKEEIDTVFSKHISSLISEIEGFNKIYDKYFF